MTPLAMPWGIDRSHDKQLVARQCVTTTWGVRVHGAHGGPAARWHVWVAWWSPVSAGLVARIDPDSIY